MFRLLLRFSIRDLLWLTVVVALAIGWWVDHRELESRKSKREYIAKLKDALRSEIGRADAFRQVLGARGGYSIGSRPGKLPPELENEPDDSDAPGQSPAYDKEYDRGWFQFLAASLFAVTLIASVATIAAIRNSALVRRDLTCHSN